LGNTKRVAVKR